MDFEEIFPPLNKISLPEVLTKILLHLSYNEDIRRFRLISKGWRNFIEQEMLARPNVKRLLKEKRFVDQWTKEPLVSRFFFKGVEPKQSIIPIISGDFVYAQEMDDGTARRNVYMDDDTLVGYVNPTPNYHFLDLVALRDGHFVNLNDFYWHTPLLQLKAYKKQSADSMELVPCTLDSSISLVGRRIIGLTRAEADRLILVCVEVAGEAGNVVIIDLADDSQKVISVGERAAQSRLKIEVVADSREIVLYWSESSFLQLINLAKGEEVWHSAAGTPPSGGWILRNVLKTSVFIGIIMRKQVYIPTTGAFQDSWWIQIFDNANGHLLNSFSMNASFMLANWGAAGSYLSWAHPRPPSYTEMRVIVLNVKSGRGVSIDATYFHPACFATAAQQTLLFIGVVRGRLLLTDHYCTSCSTRSLAALDVLDDRLRPVVIDSRRSVSGWYAFSPFLEKVRLVTTGPIRTMKVLSTAA